MEKIDTINVGCCGISKTIPLAFDESMSFLEMLCAMNEKLTEVINATNTMIEEYTNIEANFDEIYAELTNLHGLIDDANAYSRHLTTVLRAELTTKIDNDIDDVYSAMNQGFSNVSVNLENIVDGLEATIDNVYTELDTKIDNAVVGQVDVYNPTNAQVEDINKVIMDIYNANRLYAITCTGFDNLELTATEYDSKQLTAYDFDNYSLELLQN